MDQSNRYVKDAKNLLNYANTIFESGEYEIGLEKNLIQRESIPDLQMIHDLIGKLSYCRELQQFKEDYLRCKQDVLTVLSTQVVTNDASHAQTALDFALTTTNSINSINSHPLLKAFADSMAFSDEGKIAVETINEIVRKQKDIVETYSYYNDFMEKFKTCSDLVDTTFTSYSMTNTADNLYEYRSVVVSMCSLEKEVEVLTEAKDSIALTQQNCKYDKCITLGLIPAALSDTLNALTVKVKYLSWLLSKKKALGALFRAVFLDDVKEMNKIIMKLKITTVLSNVMMVAGDTFCLGFQGFEWKCPNSHDNCEYSCCNVEACLKKSKCLCECDECIPYWMTQRGQRHCQFQFCELCNNCDTIKLKKCETCEGIN